MGNKGWIKRVLPFFATFAIGIFIAGLFGFGGPRFGRHGRWERRMEFERLRTENEELKNENLRLKNGQCDSSENEFRNDGLPVYPVIPSSPSHPKHVDELVAPDSDDFWDGQAAPKAIRHHPPRR